MHSASRRLNLCAALTLFSAAPALIAANGSQKQKTIVVTEGTDMAVTVSPDHKTILADIQGLIYAIPFNGGAGKQLTTPMQEASHPDWSSKGGLVALQCYAGGTFHIWTMKPDGSGLKQVTTGHGDDREPHLSPDGTTIAFASDRAFKKSYDIWTVKVDGSDLKQITSSDADEFEPTWSPDGTHIAFISGTGIQGKSIESIDLATGKQQTLVSTDPAYGRLEAPSFSPDGARISYVRFSGARLLINTAALVVSKAAPGGEIIYTGKAGDAFPFPSVWLSNSELLYTAEGKILRTDLSSGSETPISFSAAIPSNRPQYAHKKYDFDETARHQVKGIYAPALSPDGKQVA